MNNENRRRCLALRAVSQGLRGGQEGPWHSAAGGNELTYGRAREDCWPRGDCSLG